MELLSVIRRSLKYKKQNDIKLNKIIIIIKKNIISSIITLEIVVLETKKYTEAKNISI
ncbi:MAG: hypothetical protein ACRDDY_12315 [Clostridium sp.]